MVPAREHRPSASTGLVPRTTGSSAGRDIGRSPVLAVTWPGQHFMKEPLGSLCYPMPGWEETSLWSRAAGVQIASPLLGPGSS